MSERAEVRFFQSGVRDWPRRSVRMALHAHNSDRPVTLVTNMANLDDWKEVLRGLDVKITTQYRIKSEKLEGLVLVDTLSAASLLEMHKLVIKHDAEFSVIDMREGK